MGADLPLDLFFPLLGAAGRVADVAGEWLLTYALHSTALLLVAWALVALVRDRWSPAALASIWRTALVAGWVTATVQLAAPWRPLSGQLQLPRPGQRTLAAVRVDRSAQAVTTATRAIVVQRPGAPSASSALETPTVPPGRLDISPTVSRVGATEVMRVMVVGVSLASLGVAGWALVAALASTHLAWLRRRLRLVLAGRHDARDSLMGNALRYLQQRGGVRRPVTLTVTEALAVPAALTGDEIVLPLRAVHELTLGEQEAVLAHELAHVVRHDTAWLHLARWIERLAWFQPLNRLARRQMQDAAEYAADAWAARVTGQPLRLAQALARVATWRRAGGPGGPRASDASYASDAAAMAADGSPLLDRVRRLTAPGGLPGHAPVGFAPVVTMGAAALAVFLTLPQVRLQAPELPWTPSDRRAELRLAMGDGAREEIRWRAAPGTAVRVLAPGVAGGATVAEPSARAVHTEVVKLVRRPPAMTGVRGAPADSQRAVILVRRGSGTAS